MFIVVSLCRVFALIRWAGVIWMQLTPFAKTRFLSRTNYRTDHGGSDCVPLCIRQRRRTFYCSHSRRLRKGSALIDESFRSGEQAGMAFGARIMAAVNWILPDSIRI